MILASASKIRLQMLQNAGVAVEVKPARIDEAAVKSSMLAEGAHMRNIVDTLAEMKAHKIAMKHPSRLVLGSDQILVEEGNLFDKPVTVEDAKSQLRQLRGKTHRLMSAAVMIRDGEVTFRHITTAKLIMRNFSDDFLDNYSAKLGNSLTDTVGGYKLEEIGVQLFSRIEGDYFTILGLPLLECLDHLRQQGMIQQ